MTQNEKDALTDRIMRISLLLGQSIAMNYRMAELLNHLGKMPDELLTLQKEFYDKINGLYYGLEESKEKAET